MDPNDYEPLHLRRVDVARNMARFYVLSIQPTLFGGASLVWAWGRIGTNGREKLRHSMKLRMQVMHLRGLNNQRGIAAMSGDPLIDDYGTATLPSFTTAVESLRSNTNNATGFSKKLF
jgi:predicted DNA-binding WGR domain protein